MMQSAVRSSEDARLSGMHHIMRVYRAVFLANKRLVDLGLAGRYTIVYTGGSARLLSHDRLGCEEQMHEEGPPALACGLLVGRLQIELSLLGKG